MVTFISHSPEQTEALGIARRLSARDGHAVLLRQAVDSDVNALDKFGRKFVRQGQRDQGGRLRGTMRNERNHVSPRNEGPFCPAVSIQVPP